MPLKKNSGHYLGLTSWIADRRHAKTEPIEIRMTTDGFPIIPKIVMEKELKKGEWEKLLQAFLTQHYHEFSFNAKKDVLQIWPVNRSRKLYLTLH